MATAFIVLRAVHMTALVALLGGLLFDACIVARRLDVNGPADASSRWIRCSAGWLALAFVSGAAWLGFEAVTMSGLPPRQALLADTLRAVLLQTQFGRVWVVRCLLGLAFAGLLVVADRQHGRRQPRLLGSATILACGLIASLALVGHANSEQGTQRWVHLTADALHLLAAGAWLGTLPSLVAELARDRRFPDPATDDRIARATRRFSVLGLISVGVLVVTGAVNAWFTVGTLTALGTTPYGHLLLIKLGLFGAMVGLAAINRLRLMPRLSARQRQHTVRADAQRSLQRNAALEAVFGLLVLCIVGALGVTMPAAHLRSMPASMHMR